MEIDLINKPKHNQGNIAEHRIAEAHKISTRIRGKYSGLITTTAINRNFDRTDEFEIIVIIDDLNNTVLNETKEDIKISVAELAYQGALKLKGTTYLTSEIWEGVKSKDENILSVLRNSYILEDRGFFQPIQDLLVTGRLRPSSESTKIFYIKADKSLKKANEHVGRAIIDLYWAVTDAVHAAIMSIDIMPPSPKELAGLTKDHLVNKKLVDAKCPEMISTIYDSAKKIMHKQQFDFTGKEYDQLLSYAEFVVHEMKKFVKNKK